MGSNRLLLIVCPMIGISEGIQQMLTLRCLWLDEVVLILTLQCLQCDCCSLLPHMTLSFVHPRLCPVHTLGRVGRENRANLSYPFWLCF